MGIHDIDRRQYFNVWTWPVSNLSPVERSSEAVKIVSRFFAHALHCIIQDMSRKAKELLQGGSIVGRIWV